MLAKIVEKNNILREFKNKPWNKETENVMCEAVNVFDISFSEYLKPASKPKADNQIKVYLNKDNTVYSAVLS